MSNMEQKLAFRDENSLILEQLEFLVYEGLDSDLAEHLLEHAYENIIELEMLIYGQD